MGAVIEGLCFFHSSPEKQCSMMKETFAGRQDFSSFYHLLVVLVMGKSPHF